MADKPEIQLAAVAAPAPASTAAVPPGAPEGGVWGTNEYSGNKTMAAAGCCCILSCLGCFMFLCPLDERDAYKAPDGTVSLCTLCYVIL